MAVASFGVGRAAGTILKGIIPAAKAPRSESLFKSLFCNPENKVACYVNKTSGIDKALKTSIAASELTKGILLETGGSSSSLVTANNVLTTLKDARSVLVLTNAFNGALPGAVLSARACFESVKRACRLPSVEEEVQLYDGKAYNKQVLSRKEHILAAIKAGGDCVGAATFVTVFGGLRSTMLADKLTSGGLVSREVKSQLGLASDVLMTANHCAAIIGGGASILSENIAYERAKEALSNSGVETSSDELEGLRSVHYQALKKTLLGILEKALEFVTDVLKFVPTVLPQASMLIVKGALGLVIGGLGMYKVWSSSK